MTRPDDRSDKALFDFITNPEFKANLKSDYDELQAAVKNGQWKAAHVLAGSIIEAILIDYLISVGHGGHSENDLLKWDMGKLIPAGKTEGILSDKTAQMCVVVKDYRNLIHPGRVVRLKETVTEEGATVALALVKIVAKDIGKKKAEVYGYTAEQLVTKLEIDPACTSYLPLILKDMKPLEKRRLLLEVLPERNFQWYSSPPVRTDWASTVIQDTRTAFSQCFRLVRAQVPWDVQKEVIGHYVSILKELTAAYRECYEEAFVRCTDLRGVADYDEIEIIKGHLLGRLSKGYDFKVLTVATGIGGHITPDDLKTKAARSLWMPVFSCPEEERESFFSWFSDQHLEIPDWLQVDCLKDMQDQADLWRATDRGHFAALLQETIEKRLPF